jgi:hypothetical protein
VKLVAPGRFNQQINRQKKRQNGPSEEEHFRNCLRKMQEQIAQRGASLFGESSANNEIQHPSSSGETSSNTFLEGVDPILRAMILEEHAQFCDNERQHGVDYLQQLEETKIQDVVTIPEIVNFEEQEADEAGADSDAYSKISSLTAISFVEEMSDFDEGRDREEMVAVYRRSCSSREGSSVAEDESVSPADHASAHRHCEKTRHFKRRKKEKREVSSSSSSSSSVCSMSALLGDGQYWPPNYHQKRIRLQEPYALRISLYEKFIVMYEECLNSGDAHNLLNHVVYPLVHPDITRLNRTWMSTTGSTSIAPGESLKPIQVIESIGLDYFIADIESVFQHYPKHYSKFANLKVIQTEQFVRLVVSYAFYLQGLPNSSSSPLIQPLASQPSASSLSVSSAAVAERTSFRDVQASYKVDAEEFLSELVTEMPPELEEIESTDSSKDPSASPQIESKLKDITEWVEPVNTQLQSTKLVGYNTFIFNNEGKITQMWSDYTPVMY